MQKRALKVTLLAVLALVLVLSFSGVALADQTWSDLPDSVTAKYGITDNQVAEISDGFAGGLWKPFQSVTRAQFTKMAVAAFDINLANPATASFTDVPKGSIYFQYIEGAKAVGAVNGTTATTFSPNATITREQAIAIVARYIAMANDYDLATMYTPAEVDALLAHFGDKASIGSTFKNEVAFAFDFGITEGDAFGNVAPQAKLTRIQAAAFLIRAAEKIPPATFIPAKIELVSADKSENLIGIPRQVTFKVTDAAGHPAIGVLVDFDTMFANPLYVGNISPQAAVTNNFGEVTVNLLSAEPGTQRVSAAVNGVAAIYTTAYWLAMDEIYIMDEVRESRNNVGQEHEWCARVVVIGPGPRSTSQFDWYNAIDASFDPADLQVGDGIWDSINDYGDELDLPAGYVPRTMAGIGVDWDIVNVVDDNPLTTTVDETVPSVGDIIEVDGAAIVPALSALGETDADGISCITIYSEEIGDTRVQAVATYPENPYPQMLFDRDTADPEDWEADDDWEQQPKAVASALKTWIAHTLPSSSGPISPAATIANIGEEKTLTVTLVDVFGNPVAGAQVEWFMQGVGFFQTDDGGDTSDPDWAANNKDFDVTDAAGKATVFVKSYDAGQQIVHAKVQNKGTGGGTGAWTTYTAEVQWYDVNVATFDNPATNWTTVANNEAVSSNPVGGTHTFDMWVFGLKLAYAPTVDYPDDQTPWIDSDYTGSAYDGIIDWKDAAYFGGILLVNDETEQGGQWAFDDDGDGIIESDEVGTATVMVNGRTLTLSLLGGYTEYDWDQDGLKEDFTGQTGIYVPLAGKTVTFTKANQTGGANFSNLGADFTGADVAAVGSFTPATAVTDAAGKVSVTVTSNIKGPETIKGTVDWAGNPHNGPQLVSAFAKKAWVAGTVAGASDLTIEIWIDGVKVYTNKDGELAEGNSPMWIPDPDTGDLVLNSAHVEVHVKDAFGNDLPDYEVVYLLNDIGEWLGGSQGAANTYIPWAYLADLDTENDDLDDALTWFDQNGTRPDADEPTPESDPYAYIVGPGGTPAFFFNQWLGSEKSTDFGQPGVERWFERMGDAPFSSYMDDAEDVAVTQGWEAEDADWLFDGFDGVLDFDAPVGPEEVGLATNGAKAWTLDGFYDAGEGSIEPNLLTGSNIDIQLAEDATEIFDATHYKSILRVMIYAPADGVVVGGTPIFSAQVHQTWEVPVVTSVTLSPAADYAIAGTEYQTVVATVKDQFGNPMPGIDVEFASTILEGVLTNLAEDSSPVTTDENGNAAVDWNQSAGDWGVESIVATADGVASNAAVIQWIYDDTFGNFVDEEAGGWGDLVNAVDGQQKVTAWFGFTPWNGKTLRVYLNPGAAILGSHTYVVAVDTDISTGAHTWDEGDPFFVGAVSTNIDGVPNWVYDVTLAEEIIIG